MCVYVCVFVYVCLRGWVYAWVRVCVCVRACVCVYMCVRLCRCVSVGGGGGEGCKEGRATNMCACARAHTDATS